MKLESKAYDKVFIENTRDALKHGNIYKALELRDDRQYLFIGDLKCGFVTYLTFIDLDDIRFALSEIKELNIACTVPCYTCEGTKIWSLSDVAIINDFREKHNLFWVGEHLLMTTIFEGELHFPEVAIWDVTYKIRDNQVIVYGVSYNISLALDITTYISSDDDRLQKKIDLLKINGNHLKVKDGLLWAADILEITSLYKRAKVFKKLVCNGALCEIPKDSIVTKSGFKNCTVACNCRRQGIMQYVNSKVYFNKPCVVSKATFLDCEIIINAPVILHNVSFEKCQLRVHDACSIKYAGFNSKFDVNVKIE